MARKKKAEERDKSGDWLLTYSDMITLCLCFFAVLFNPVDPQDIVLQAVSEYFSELNWGMSLSTGQMADTGNIAAQLPSATSGRVLGETLKRAISLFNPQVNSNKVKITQDERGVIISFASDVFFEPASATLNIESSREILLNLVSLLNSREVAGRKFRIEGHADSSPIDPEGIWRSNWELSSARALNVLHYLVDLGVPENRMQVAGFGSTMPISSDDTAEGRMFNRRVDIVIIDDGHL